MTQGKPKYFPPQFLGRHFNCPNCGVLAPQRWAAPTGSFKGSRRSITSLQAARCDHCTEFSIWIRGLLVDPDSFGAPPPNDDLGEDVKSDYLEAASILNKSPRGAAGLLRLAVQKLCIQLGEKGKDLNTDIGNLVKQGLPDRIKKALDIVRVIGNNAVHPGQIDLEDAPETAAVLFELINQIADSMITQPSGINRIYESLPEGAREQIEKRDKSVHRGC